MVAVVITTEIQPLDWTIAVQVHFLHKRRGYELGQAVEYIYFEMPFDEIEQGCTMRVGLFGLGLRGGRASTHVALLGELQGGLFLTLLTAEQLLLLLDKEGSTS